MQPLFLYLVKMAVCSAALLVYYWLALRNERFHQWNRFYLLAAVILSIIVPLLHIPIAVEKENSQIADIVSAIPWNESELVSATHHEPMNSISIFWIVASFLSSLLLLRLLNSFLQISVLYKKHKSLSFRHIRLIYTNEKSAPFSFFKWLFWRIDIDPASENGKRMLKHELAHIHQKHSADKLFIEVALILFWCNPFFWIIKKELHAIHEFLADEKAFRDADGASFAATILRAVNVKPCFDISNPFFSSSLKRRIMMITTSKKPTYSYLRRISALVIITIITAGLDLTFEQAKAQKTQQEDTQNQTATSAAVVHHSEFPGGPQAWNRYLERNLHYSKAAIDANATGTVTVQFAVSTNGNISDIKALNDPGYGFAQEAVRIIKEGPMWVPEEKDGHKVPAIVKREITFKGLEKTSSGALIFNTPQKNAQFPGGRTELLRYMKIAQKQTSLEGMKYVSVQFLVHPDGSLSDLHSAYGSDEGLANKAITILKKGPKWQPAMEGGKAVTMKVQQTIPVVLD